MSPITLDFSFLLFNRGAKKANQAANVPHSMTESYLNIYGRPPGVSRCGNSARHASGVMRGQSGNWLFYLDPPLPFN